MSIDYSAMAFPKASWKQKEEVAPEKRKRKKKIKLKKGPKHRKRKSIMQDEDDNRCYLCMLLHGDYHEKVTQEHHVVFGSGRRSLSTEYGLTVRLCVDEHHEVGPESVHNNQEIAELLKVKAQERFNEVYPDLDWMEVIKRNYLEVEDETTEEITLEIQETGR